MNHRSESDDRKPAPRWRRRKDTRPTEIYTLSLHDALPICRVSLRRRQRGAGFLSSDSLR